MSSKNYQEKCKRDQAFFKILCEPYPILTFGNKPNQLPSLQPAKSSTINESKPEPWQSIPFYDCLIIDDHFDFLNWPEYSEEKTDFSEEIFQPASLQEIARPRVPYLAAVELGIENNQFRTELGLNSYSLYLKNVICYPTRNW